MEYYPDELYHHGIKGMKWGVRRYQNPDGSLTAAGRVRYGAGQAREKVGRAYGSARDSVSRAYSSGRSKAKSAVQKAKNTYNRKVTKDDIGKIAATAATVAVAALAIKHRKALYAGAKIATSVAKQSGKRMVNQISSSVAAKGKAFVVKSGQHKKARNLYKTTGIINNDYLRKTDKFAVDAGKKLTGAASTAKSKINSAARGAQLKRQGKAANRTSDHFDFLRERRAMREGGKDLEQISRSQAAKLRARQGANNAIDWASEAPGRLRNTVRTTASKVGSSAARKRRIGNQVEDAMPGVRTAVRNKASQAKFDAQRYGRVASLKGRTAYAKTKVGIQNAAGKAKETIGRRQRIGRQVNGAFNSPTRYLGTHTTSQVARDVGRRAVGAVAGTAAGGALGYNIDRVGRTTKRKRKK